MKRLHVLLFTLLLLATTAGTAQNEGNIWHFGYGYGLDFTNIDPVPFITSSIRTWEGCASRCDADGNLLFYTNGGGRVNTVDDPSISTGGIWNANDALMYDMQGLEGGGPSAAQSSVIVPKPGSNNVFYLFTMEETEFDTDGIPDGQEQGRGFSYFEVDMTLNGGLGEVTVADENVHVPSYESLAAALHSNGEDYWVVIVDNNTENFFVYEITAAGVSAPAVRSRAALSQFSGPIKISPDRRQLFEGGYLYRFGANNGSIQDPVAIRPENPFVASAFSHSGRFLYLFEQDLFSEDALIYWYDTEADDVLASEQLVATVPTRFAGQMQIGPDDRIYCTSVDINSPSTTIMGRINCPNSSSPVYEDDLFSFLPPVGEVVQFPALGLPNFTDHIFINDLSEFLDLGEDQNLDCGAPPIVLDAQNPGSEYIWSTGETTQTIEVDQAGIYYVTVTAECTDLMDSITITTENFPPEVSIDGQLTVCPGGTTTLTGSSNEVVDFLWSTGTATDTILVDKPDTYFLTVTDACGVSRTDSVEVIFLENSEIELLQTVDVICEGAADTIRAFSLGADSYVWSDGSVGPDLVVSEGGTYQLTVTNVCEELVTTVVVQEFPLPTVELQGDPILCPGGDNVLEAVAEDATDYVWSTGQNNPQITATEWGLYTVEASNACGAASDSLRLSPLGCENCLYVPNAFSPNDDGRNDLFQPVPVCPLDDYQLQVFSRWGALVYETETFGTGWDGNFRGATMPSGVYVWVIRYQQAGQMLNLSGDLSLLR